MNVHHLDFGNDFQRPMFVVVVMLKANAKRCLERFFHYVLGDLSRGVSLMFPKIRFKL